VYLGYVNAEELVVYGVDEIKYTNSNVQFFICYANSNVVQLFC
jgi:hypothetical protein